jgi:glycosyltransferase involved in cell wall biosynthesis
MDSDRRVVALVPAWNAAGFIQGTLEALSAQTHRNLDILVSVDLSTDDTADICESYRRIDSRVRVLRQGERLGFVGNTSRPLQAAQGDYFFWAWHDDILLPEYVSRLVPVLEHSMAAWGSIQRTAVRRRAAGRDRHVNDERLVILRDDFESMRTRADLQVAVVATESVHQPGVPTIHVDQCPSRFDIQLQPANQRRLRRL